MKVSLAVANQALPWFLVVALLLSGGALAWSDQGAGSVEQDSQEQRDRDQVENQLRVASLLVKDGHFERAAATLAGISPRTEDQRARHLSLSGLVALRRGDHLRAGRELAAAIKAGLLDKEKEQSAYLFLAQARFKGKDCEGMFRALKGAEPLAERYPGVTLMQVQCSWQAGNTAAAWRVLKGGLARHGQSRDLRRQEVMLMVNLGLYQQAMAAGERFFARFEGVPDDFVALAEALRRGKQHRRAILILERGRLLFPRDDRILKQLARSYLEDQKPFVAAELLARAAARTARYRLEAAELYRRAGRPILALHFNNQVIDQRSKTRQRLGLLVELARYEEAAAMAPRLSRLGLLEDDGLLYTLAYALYKIGRFEVAEVYLRRITTSEIFNRGVQLRKAMDSCRQMGWECVL